MFYSEKDAQPVGLIKTNQKITKKAVYLATEILEPIVRPVNWLKILALGFDPRNLLLKPLKKIQYL